MKEKQAREHLEHFLLGCQKIRSGLLEKGFTENDIASLYYWLGGKANIILGLEKELQREAIVPFNFYNFMGIAQKIPPVLLWCELKEVPLPGPEDAWLKGFDVSKEGEDHGAS